MPSLISKFCVLLASIFFLSPISLFADSIPDSTSSIIAPFEVRIDLVDNQLQGHFVAIRINSDCDLKQFSGFDLAVSYDDRALELKDACPGGRLINAGWTKFSYSTDRNIFRGSHLLMPIIKISASQAPDSVTKPGDDIDNDPNSLVLLKFFITNDRTYEGSFNTLKFFWSECDDNRFILRRNDLNVIIGSVRDSAFERGYHFRGQDQLYPPQRYYALSPTCPDSGSSESLPIIKFVNGGIRILGCDVDESSPSGDINCNGLGFEQADAGQFASYFVSGFSAFDNHVECSIAGTNINGDNTYLEPNDLQLLIRVVIGDALTNRIIGDSSLVQIAARHRKDQLILESSGQDSIGLALFTLTGAPPGTIPTAGTGVGKMNMIYGQSADTLKILIYAIDKLWIEPGISELVRIPYSKSLRLESAKLVDYWGGYIRTEIAGRISEH